MPGSKAARLFCSHSSAPLYFAYLYQPKKEIGSANLHSLKIMDVLALFIHHAKTSQHNQVKMVLPINVEDIEQAKHLYPSIFNECAIQYTDLTSTREFSQGSALNVEVFNLFPFSNTTFRLLMDYAAEHDTPIVTTGDQSFIELFFSIEHGFVFLYQLMKHKRELLEQIKSIAVTKQLTFLINVLTQTGKPIASEAELIELTEFLITNKETLKLESMQLVKEIRAQPDLVDSLANVIVACMEQKKMLFNTDEETELNSNAPSPT